MMRYFPWLAAGGAMGYAAASGRGRRATDHPVHSEYGHARLTLLKDGVTVRPLDFSIAIARFPRRKGTGTKLFADVLAAARQHFPQAHTMRVYAANEAVASFWKKQGFRVVGPGGFDSILLERPLYAAASGRGRRAAPCVEGRTDPDLWAKVKKEVTAGTKGGRSGQWSARKAQMAVQRYKAKGGTYCGPKTKAQKSLTRWTEEDWGSDRKGDRYLPKKAREALTDAEYRRTSAKKRRDTARGKQFSSQPSEIARKTARHRGRSAKGSYTRADIRALGYSDPAIQRALAALESTPSGRDAGPRGAYVATPPKRVRDAAFKGLKIRAQMPKSRRGGTDIGVGRAIQLALGQPIPERSIRRMRAYFSRHAKDFRPYWDAPGDETKGYIAWMLWGGDPGRAWAEKKYRSLK